jgi:hypothetical protein
LFFSGLIELPPSQQNKILPYFADAIPVPDRASYYPSDITDEELEGLFIIFFFNKSMYLKYFSIGPTWKAS